jgi:predicted RNA-binding Zn-ribbon protein involved in translation (DUF1610 family)
MNYFFTLLIVSNFAAYAMDGCNNINPQLLALPKNSKINLKRSKWNDIRIPINQENDKSRKWAFICNTCNKTVIDIVRHKRSHTKECPYVCPTCKTTFTEPGACAKHIRTKHKEVKNPTYEVKFPQKEPYTRTVKKKKSKKEVGHELVEKSHELLSPDLCDQNLNRDAVAFADFFVEHEIFLLLEEFFDSEIVPKLFASNTK